MELNSHLILALLPLLTVCFLVPSIQAISVEYCGECFSFYYPFGCSSENGARNENDIIFLKI